MRKSEVQVMFEQDIREKKRAGSGVFSRTGKGVKHTIRGIRNPSDLLKGKEKREYTKASAITMSNIYEEIIPRSEFELLEPHIQKNMFSYWYLTHGIKEIQRGMQIGSQTVYDIKERLGIPNKGKENKVKRKGVSTTVKDNLAKAREIKAKKKELESPQTNRDALPSVVQTFDAPTEPKKEIDLDGLQLKYKGFYKSEQIQKILQKLDLLVSDEENEFYLEVKLVEKK